MKNKHLVLLFLLTLGIGLAIRHAPWRDPVSAHIKLLPTDTSEIRRIEVLGPGESAIVLTLNDAGWDAEQKNRSTRVPPLQAHKLLAALADLSASGLIKTTGPDTLGFSAASMIRVTVFYANEPAKYLEIGSEITKNGITFTYVRLFRHEGVYMVESQIRPVFSSTLADYRSAAVPGFDPNHVQGISIFGKGLDSLVVQWNDSLDCWLSIPGNRRVQPDRISKWLEAIRALKTQPFADLFDETLASKAVYAQITLQLRSGAAPFTIKIFHLNHPVWPEEMPEATLEKRQLSPYVYCFSQYPTNFYMLSDTTLLPWICQPF